MENKKFILPLFGVLVFSLISCKSKLKDEEIIRRHERMRAELAYQE